MKRMILAMSIVLLVTAACSTAPTGDTAGDATAAQSFLPTLDGYSATEADSITEALSAAAGEGADIFGNEGVQVIVDRLDTFVACYQDVGAVSARVYTQANLGSLLGGNVPSVGAVAVVNQDRVRENFVACATGGQQQGFSAQSVSVEPCTGNGSFTSGGDSFSYIFAGSSGEFCNAVQNHFAGIS